MSRPDGVSRPDGAPCTTRPLDASTWDAFAPDISPCRLDHLPRRPREDQRQLQPRQPARATNHRTPRPPGISRFTRQMMRPLRVRVQLVSPGQHQLTTHFPGVHQPPGISGISGRLAGPAGLAGWQDRQDCTQDHSKLRSIGIYRHLSTAPTEKPHTQRPASHAFRIYADKGFLAFRRFCGCCYGACNRRSPLFHDRGPDSADSAESGP
jgi:hypothetical protein